MDLFVSHSSNLNGKIEVPGDKSISHRAAIFAAMATGKSEIHNFLDAEVTQVLLNCLSAFGVRSEYAHNTLSIISPGLKNLHAPDETLYCGHSATTMRLLAGLLAASGVSATLDGSEGLRQRPMKRIIEPLRQMGVSISSSAEHTAPISFGARDCINQPLESVRIPLAVASAQVKTCLLIASFGASGTCLLREPRLSRDHTERLLHWLGISVQQDEVGWLGIPPDAGKLIKPFQLKVPGDFSAAAFLITAALISENSHIEIQNVGLNPTRTGYLEVLQSMGAKITLKDQSELENEPVGTIIAQSSSLMGTEVSGELVVRMIDEFPIFAVAAANATGKSIVKQAEELRYKESDRIESLVSGFQGLGVDIQERSDGFEIMGPCHINAARVPSANDHRLAMALGVLGLKASSGIQIQGAEIIDQSFPNFVNTLKALGANVELHSERA